MKYTLLLYIMKNLYIALMAFAFTLGVTSCKKTESAGLSTSSVQKKEVKLDLKDKTTAVVDPTSPGAPGGGADSYPHNTGACICGKYAGCHPDFYWTEEYTSDGFGYLVEHKTAYGQTTFPPGARFYGNKPRD